MLHLRRECLKTLRSNLSKKDKLYSVNFNQKLALDLKIYPYLECKSLVFPSYRWRKTISVNISDHFQILYILHYGCIIQPEFNFGLNSAKSKMAASDQPYIYMYNISSHWCIQCVHTSFFNYEMGRGTMPHWMLV